MRIAALARRAGLFALTALLLCAPSAAGQDPDPAQDPAAAQAAAWRKRPADASRQYRPSADGKSFVWYLQYARSADVFPDISALLDVETGAGDLVLTELPDDNAILVRIKNDEKIALRDECLDLFRQIDDLPGLVMIDVLIAQVSLTDRDGRGFEWEHFGFDSLNQPGLAVRTTVNHGTIAVPGARKELNGLKVAAEKTDRVKQFLHALKEDNRVDVLSQPHLLAMNNKKATFRIQNVVPIVTSTTLQDGVVNSQETEPFDAGIVLEVTPRIGKGRQITLDVNQKIDEIVNYDPVEKQARTINRTLDTRLRLRHGQTMVMGGFVKNEKRWKDEKVPVLSGLPGIGRLFNRRDLVDGKSEIVIFLTPRIIETSQDSDDATGLMKRRLTDPGEVDRHIEAITAPVDSPDETDLVPRGAKGWRCAADSKAAARLLDGPPAPVPTGELFARAKRPVTGSAPFGYGPPKVNSVVYATRLQPAGNYVFARSFDVDAETLAAAKQVRLRVASDNAALVWINGEPVDRDPWINTRSGHDFEYWNRDIVLPASLLREGKNEIAVALRNERRSDEAHFDLRLSTRHAVPPAPHQAAAAKGK